jgi:DNA-binding winged helix-turn-helix (wHTH) protein
MVRLTDGFLLGDCEVLASRHRIRRQGHPPAGVEPKAMEVLLCLATAKGAVVAREDILARVWPGRYVTEHVLSRSISALRKALGDDARSPRYIETIHTRGFRLLQPVAPLAPMPAEVTSAALAPTAPTTPSSANGHPPAKSVTPVAPGRSRRWEMAFVAAILAGVGALAAVVADRASSAAEAPEPLLVPITAERGSELDPAPVARWPPARVRGERRFRRGLRPLRRCRRRGSAATAHPPGRPRQ